MVRPPLEPFAPILRDIRGTRAAGLISWRMIASRPSQPGGTLTSIAQGRIDRCLSVRASSPPYRVPRR